MNVLIANENLQELCKLVERPVEQHRKYPYDIEELDRKINVRDGIKELRKAFVSLQDSLVERVLVEEFEVYPELMRKNLFDSAISSIMQQHVNVVSCLKKMELSFRLLRSCLLCGW